ncbi:hypothetical protein D4764_01G0001960 [Takifugu flavidus]|uniref:Uncharacterized protein n=1 Tax=Takifugu flavidus TaxID=433684 RepID=A0A5C6PNF0_9TELE|nr:hypothetical protein D4764_01G0001960 [Takifugu flavidus]
MRTEEKNSAAPPRQRPPLRLATATTRWPVHGAAWLILHHSPCAPNPGSMCNSCPSLPKSLPTDSCLDLRPRRVRSESVARRRAQRSRGSGESPRSLGRSVRRRFGPRHHNIYAANCCLGCHSTKGASWSPPGPRASIGSGRAVSHALARTHWTARLSINFKAARPPPAFDEWADRFSGLLTGQAGRKVRPLSQGTFRCLEQSYYPCRETRPTPFMTP